MTSGKLAYENVRKAATQWAKKHGYDSWMTDVLYVQAHADSWSTSETETASRAAQYAWRLGSRHCGEIRIVSGLVPCLVGILIAYLQLGYGKDDSVKWLLTSVGSAVGALIALFEALGGSTEKDRASTWRALCEKLIGRLTKLEQPPGPPPDRS